MAGGETMIKEIFASVTVLLLFATVALAQTPVVGVVSQEVRAAANEAYQKQNWQAAVDNYEKIVKAEPQNAGAAYRLGVSFLNLKRAKNAQLPLETAMGISANSVFALALARVYAANGEKEKMYQLFERSLTLGGVSAESLNDEKDFAGVKSEARFVEYVKKLDGVANPCRSRREFREFDFLDRGMGSSECARRNGRHKQHPVDSKKLHNF